MEKFELVILIDDDKIINFINEKTIKQANAADKVIAFTKAADALEFIKVNCEENCKDVSSALIFLDLNMPVMDGWDFLDKLKGFPEFPSNKCRVIILSSSIDPADFDKMNEYDAVEDFISKPLTKEHLYKLTKKTLLTEPRQ